MYVLWENLCHLSHFFTNWSASLNIIDQKYHWVNALWAKLLLPGGFHSPLHVSIPLILCLLFPLGIFWALYRPTIFYRAFHQALYSERLLFGFFWLPSFLRAILLHLENFLFLFASFLFVAWCFPPSLLLTFDILLHNWAFAILELELGKTVILSDLQMSFLPEVCLFICFSWDLFNLHFMKFGGLIFHFRKILFLGWAPIPHIFSRTNARPVQNIRSDCFC